MKRMKSMFNGGEIAIVRLSAFGDILHTLPAAQLLIHSFPESRIHWICSPRGAELLRCFQIPINIQVIDFKGQPITGSLSSLRKLRAENHEKLALAADFQGLIKSALVARACSRRVLGFHKNNLRERPAALFYSMQAEPYPESRHVIHKNIHMLSAIHIFHQGSVTFPPLVDSISDGAMDSFRKSHSLKKRDFILLNVGGGWPTKVLPFRTMAELVSRLRKDFPVLLLWGTEEEKAVARKLSGCSDALVCPETGFHGLFSLISASRIVISGDTLALHAADAAGIPSVGYFGPTSPERNGSILTGSRSVVSNESCRFCYRRACDTMRCMLGISTDALMEAVREVLNAPG